MKKNCIKILMSLAILSTFIVGCDNYQTDTYNENKSKKTIILDDKQDNFVDAEVYNKDYVEAEDRIVTVPISNCGRMTLIPRTEHEDEKFNVTLKYEDITTTINNKELYNKVKKGDKIKVRIFKSWTGYRSLMI